MRCMNWCVCHNEAKRGRELCQRCIDEAVRMDNPEYIPQHERERNHGERRKEDNRHQKQGQR